MFELELSIEKWIQKNWAAGFLAIPARIAFGFSGRNQVYLTLDRECVSYLDPWVQSAPYVEEYSGAQNLQVSIVLKASKAYCLNIYTVPGCKFAVDSKMQAW